MKFGHKICYYTAVCEEDQEFVGTYFADAQRLSIPVLMHFDRCSDGFIEWVRSHPNCVGSTRRNTDKEFSEKDKQGVLDLAISMGFEWLCNMDIDETWERDARHKIDEIISIDHPWEVTIQVKWLNLWNDPEHIRMDGHFGQGHRCKFLRRPRKGQKYRYRDHTTNGPTLYACKALFPKRVIRPTVIQRLDLVCLHWGMMTKEMREFHKQRWDRIYGTTSGRNPYGFWDDALDETGIKVVKHDY